MSSEPVIVVTGLPRTGTSLMMQMLAVGGLDLLTDAERAPDDNNPRGYYEYEPVKSTRQDIAWVSDAPGKVVKVVIPILFDLPAAGFSYQVIFMQRSLDEILQSQTSMLARLGKKGAALSSDQLKKVYETQLSKADDWLSNDVVIDHVKVSYTELINLPNCSIQQVQKLLSTLDRTLDMDAMASVIDPTLYRERA